MEKGKQASNGPIFCLHILWKFSQRIQHTYKTLPMAATNKICRHSNAITYTTTPPPLSLDLTHSHVHTHTYLPVNTYMLGGEHVTCEETEIQVHHHEPLTCRQDSHTRRRLQDQVQQGANYNATHTHVYTYFRAYTCMNTYSKYILFLLSLSLSPCLSPSHYLYHPLYLSHSLPQLLTTIPLDITLKWVDQPVLANRLTYSSSHIIGLGLRGENPHDTYVPSHI